MIFPHGAWSDKWKATLATTFQDHFQMEALSSMTYQERTRHMLAGSAQVERLTSMTMEHHLLNVYSQA
jgi:hypothetical protein